MCPITIPLLATCPGHMRLNCMAMSPPPSHFHSYVAAPLQPHRPQRPPPSSCACWTPSYTAMVLPPSQLHMSPPLCHLHGPCHSMPRSWMHYAAAPITAMHAVSPHALLLHRPCHPPHSHTALPHTLQLGGPCHPLPLNHASHVTTCLAARWATLPPPSQLGTPHYCMPCS